MPLLRRLTVLLVILGVMLVTMGTAWARCAAGDLHAAMPGMAQGMGEGGDHRAPDAPSAPAHEREATCLATLHCGITVPATDAPIAPAGARVARGALPAYQAAHLETSLEPVVPPPRG